MSHKRAGIHAGSRRRCENRAVGYRRPFAGCAKRGIRDRPSQGAGDMRDEAHPGKRKSRQPDRADGQSDLHRGGNKKMGKRPTSRRCDLLPLLPSGPDGVQRELAVWDLPNRCGVSPRKGALSYNMEPCSVPTLCYPRAALERKIALREAVGGCDNEQKDGESTEEPPSERSHWKDLIGEALSAVVGALRSSVPLLCTAVHTATRMRPPG